MANFNTLPYEIQQLILQHIDSRRQLGECRRVSKIWDVPAECAMFSRQLRLTQKNISPLYEHLCKKPSRAHLIKEISFDHSFANRGFPEFTVPLLQMAITPSIEKIDTLDTLFDLDIRFYQTLTRMVRDSGMRLERLKSIPWPRDFTDTHYQTALLLKDSLEEMVIPAKSALRPHKISTQLDEFKNLTKLRVEECVFDSLAQVESIFRGAGNLMEIDLCGCYLEDGEAWSDEERLDWMERHVEINQNAISLRAWDDQSMCISLIEYFLFRYSNIRQFDYRAEEAEDMDLDTEISAQTCSLISKIPSYVLNLGAEQRWRTHYESFAGSKNLLRLYYGDMQDVFDGYERQYISSIVKQDGERYTQFNLVITDIYMEGFFDAHVTFLQDISTFITHMHINLEGFDLQDDLVGMRESKVFFKSLELLNHLEKMEFIASDNSLVSVQLDLPPQHSKRRLKRLEIIGAQIEPAMYHTLDHLYHTIKRLKLSCSLIKKDMTNTVFIRMPSTALGKLILTTELGLPFLSNHQREIQAMTSLKSDTYLIINLQQGVTLFFKLEPFSIIVHQISLSEYFGRQRHDTTFSISCRLLESIELDLGDIRATIDVQKYCDTLDLAAIDESKV